MTNSMIRVVVFGALLPGALLAQSSSKAAPQQNQPKLETRKPGETTSPQTQARIAREVGHVLVMIPQYGVFDNLQYKVEGSKVTLMGQVRLIVTKNNAEKAVKGIEGVEQVDNQIEVLPVYQSDNQIRLGLYQAIYGQPSLQRYQLQAIPSIHIIVNNGHVTLEGAVLNKTDSQIAEAQAKAFPGIFSVTNHLHVDQQTADRSTKK